MCVSIVPRVYNVRMETGILKIFVNYLEPLRLVEAVIDRGKAGRTTSKT